MRGPSTITFPDTLRLKVPRGLPLAIRQAAKQHHTTGPEWTRQALLKALAAQGVALVEEAGQEHRP